MLQRVKFSINMVKISVIVPVYNAGTTVNKSVGSILAQTLADFEVLLINDGSTDNSAEVCKELAEKDSRIVYIEKPNGGAASARNLGMQRAKGEYLCFVDGDDYIDPDMLEFFYNTAKNQDADIVQCGYLMENGGSVSRISASDGVFAGEEINRKMVEIKSKNLIDSPCNKAYRREFVLSSGVTMPENEAFEDTDFNLNLLKFSPKFVVCDRCFYHYVLHMGSTTRSYNKDKLSIMKRRAALLKEVTSGIDSYCDFYLVKSVFSALIDMFLGCKKGEIKKVIKNECLTDEFYAAAKNADFGGVGSKIIIAAARSRNKTVIYLASFGFYVLKYKLQKLFLKVR